MLITKCVCFNFEAPQTAVLAKVANCHFSQNSTSEFVPTNVMEIQTCPNFLRIGLKFQ